MVSLKLLFDNAPKDYRWKKNTTGILSVTRVEGSSYAQGYHWKYFSRKGGVCVSCSSSTLRGLFERCLDKGISLRIVDEGNFRRSCDSENVDYDELIRMMMKDE